MKMRVLSLKVVPEFPRDPAIWSMRNMPSNLKTDYCLFTSCNEDKLFYIIPCITKKEVKHLVGL